MSHCIDVICLSCGSNYCARCGRSYDGGENNKDMRLLWLFRNKHPTKLDKEKCQNCGKETVYFE